MKKETFLRILFIFGALFAASGVILQALTEHLPEAFFSEPHGRHYLNNATDILLWHGIALCCLTLYKGFLNPLRQCLACAMMVTGTLLFSVSVSLLSFKIINHAPVAPFGGTLLILSWLVMASAALGKTQTPDKQK